MEQYCFIGQPVFVIFQTQYRDSEVQMLTTSEPFYVSVTTVVTTHLGMSDIP